MEIPHVIHLPVTSHGHGDKGFAFYVRRNEHYGIQKEERRARTGQPWIDTWSSDYLPDRYFHSWKELREAVHAADDLAKPAFVVIGVEPSSNPHKCWTCGTESGQLVRVKTCWRPADIGLIPTCEADIERVKADPAAAIAARRAHVGGVTA